MDRPRSGAKEGTRSLCREPRGSALPSPAGAGSSGVDWPNRCAPSPPLPASSLSGPSGRSCGCRGLRLAGLGWQSGRGSPGAQAPRRRRRRGAGQSALLRGPLPAWRGPAPAWPAPLRCAWLALLKLSCAPRPRRLVTLALCCSGSGAFGMAEPSGQAGE